MYPSSLFIMFGVLGLVLFCFFLIYRFGDRAKPTTTTLITKHFGILPTNDIWLYRKNVFSVVIFVYDITILWPNFQTVIQLFPYNVFISAVQYECIMTVTCVHPNQELLEKAAYSINKFIRSKNNNLKYLGKILNTLLIIELKNSKVSNKKLPGTIES